MECKGQCKPLIFFDATIVVSFKESHIIAFIKGNLFQVKTRAVNVSNHNSYTILCKVCFACFDDKECFATIVVVEKVALVDFVPKTIFLVAVCFCHFDGFSDGFSFGFAIVEILFVAFVVVEDLFQLIGACALECVLSFVGEIHSLLLIIFN